MIIPKGYHSAFADEVLNLKELDYYKKGKSIVMFNDINNGIVKEYHNSDFIYVEPAWQNGYLKFQNRANLMQTNDYTHYLKSIQKIVIELKKPTFIIGGKHMLKRLMPDDYLKIKLNGFESLVMVWNHDIINVKNTIELVNILSKKYNTVLDFSCGYGFYLNKFKNFICSDINKKCVYFIAQKYLGYKK